MNPFRADFGTAAAKASGYEHCPCRDCFHIVIGPRADGSLPFCDDCQEAGCANEHGGTGECQSPGAYDDLVTETLEGVIHMLKEGRA